MAFGTIKIEINYQIDDIIAAIWDVIETIRLFVKISPYIQLRFIIEYKKAQKIAKR